MYNFLILPAAEPVAAPPIQSVRFARWLLLAVAAGATAAALLRVTNRLITSHESSHADAVDLTFSPSSEPIARSARPFVEPLEVWLTAAEVAASLPALSWFSKEL